MPMIGRRYTNMPNYAIQVTYYKDGKRQLSEVTRYPNSTENEVRFFYNSVRELNTVLPDEAVQIQLFDITNIMDQLDSVVKLGKNADVSWLQNNSCVELSQHELSILADSLVRTRGELTRSLNIAYEGSNKKAVIHYHELLTEVNAVRVKILKAMK
jgi:hypothetical protein